MQGLSDLAEHTGTLVTIIGLLGTGFAGVIVAIWKLNSSMLAGITAKLDHHLEQAALCQKNLPLMFASRPDAENNFSKLFTRQDRLRDEILPRDYLRRDELAAWNQLNENGFKAIAERLDIVSRRLDGLAGAIIKAKEV
jgi:hypothetical protein